MGDMSDATTWEPIGLEVQRLGAFHTFQCFDFRQQTLLVCVQTVEQFDFVSCHGSALGSSLGRNVIHLSDYGCSFLSFPFCGVGHLVCLLFLKTHRQTVTLGPLFDCAALSIGVDDISCGWK